MNVASRLPDTSAAPLADRPATSAKPPFLGFGLGLRHHWQMIETPAQLARTVVRREHEAGGGVNRLGVRREARQPLMRPPVLPADHR